MPETSLPGSLILPVWETREMRGEIGVALSALGRIPQLLPLPMTASDPSDS